jgi:putative intracellular protease/amidase
MIFPARLAVLSTAFAAALSFSLPALAVDPVAPPKKVAILIFDGVQVIDYSGPLEVFSDAGFDVFTVAASKNPVTTAAGDAVLLTPRYTFANAPQADLIVIPGGNFEATKNSATTEWIKRETRHAEHTMSVCNGAFTLANTGLLDGLRATTTAGNINRLRRGYPAITVVNDQRVVDNGKIITTAGLSAGIDGALHMVDVLKGEGWGQSVALAMELDWHPNGGLVRGKMADRVLARPDLNAVGTLEDFRLKGDDDHWEIDRWLTTKLPATELFDAVKTAYEKAFMLQGLWVTGSFKATSSGPLTADVKFDDAEGGHWQGKLSVEATSTNPHQFVVRVVTGKAG